MHIILTWFLFNFNLFCIVYINMHRMRFIKSSRWIEKEIKHWNSPSNIHLQTTLSWDINKVWHLTLALIFHVLPAKTVWDVWRELCLGKWSKVECTMDCKDFFFFLSVLSFYFTMRKKIKKQLISCNLFGLQCFCF